MKIEISVQVNALCGRRGKCVGIRRNSKGLDAKKFLTEKFSPKDPTMTEKAKEHVRVNASGFAPQSVGRVTEHVTCCR